MTNKNSVLVVIILAIALGAYFFFMYEDAEAPMTNEPEKFEETENEDYVGMTTAQAEARAEANEVMFRVVKEDGQPRPTTRDFREGRINATVANGIVTEYFVETSNTTPEDDNETVSAENNPIIGMTTAEAEVYAQANNIPFRVVSIDGESLPVTMDYRPGRMNAEIENDIVVDYTVE